MAESAYNEIEEERQETNVHLKSAARLADEYKKTAA